MPFHRDAASSGDDPREPPRADERAVTPEGGQVDWIEDLSAVWSQHQSLTAEARMLRERLRFIEEQLELRRDVIDKAQDLYDALMRARQQTTDALQALPTPLHLRPPRERRQDLPRVAPVPPPVEEEPAEDPRSTVPPAAVDAPPLEPDWLVGVRSRQVPQPPPAPPAAPPSPPAAPPPVTEQVVAPPPPSRHAAPPRQDGPGALERAREVVADRLESGVALGPGARAAAKVAKWVGMAAAALVVLALLFVTVGPRFLPYQALVVRSGSMTPTIPTGSLVLYKKAQAVDIKRGDIIVFSKPGDPTERVTHRVYSIGNGPAGRYFTTKGDANGAPDDWRVPAIGSGWVAFAHVPDVGYALGYLQTGTARLLLIVVPALALGVITLFELWTKDGREDGDGRPSPRREQPTGRSSRGRRRRRRVPSGGAGGALTVAMALLLSGGLVSGTFAAFSTQTTNLGGAYSDSFLTAPGALSALQPIGNDIGLTWTAGQNGNGYTILGVNNTTSANCPAAGPSYTQLVTTSGAGLTYQDANRATASGNNQGDWFCYEVQTRYSSAWTSVNSNPTRAVKLGVVVASVAVSNGTGASQTFTGSRTCTTSGTANQLDCGDQITITFNQQISGSAPPNTDTVCAEKTGGAILLGSTTTSGSSCASSETLAVGSLAGGTLGKANRFYSNYALSTVTDATSGATVSRLVVTVGPPFATNTTVSTSGTWSIRAGTPETPTTATFAAQGGSPSVCFAATTGCRPAVTGSF